MKRKTIGVLGLGLFGSSVAKTLAENEIDVIAMDTNMDHVEEVVDLVDVAIQGDFTKINQLQDAGFAECDEVVIASAEKLENTILAVLNLKKLNVPLITAKTKSEDYREVLEMVGASRVILPEIEMGVQMGTMLSNPIVSELVKLDDRYNVIEFQCQESWLGKTIVEIDFRNNYNTNIIAIRPKKTDEFDIEFGPDYVVTKGDIFLGITTDEGMRELMKP
ncbi:MAG: TrkA family potassium uptake protein [Atopostipes suicloacalis]|nr:TrkA family potassium uptake protein [Atopostipes suicloacalis]